MTYLKKLTPQEIKSIAIREPDFCRKELLGKDDLLAAVQAYFRFCIEKEEHPTMSGLALSLGVTRKDLLSLTHHDPDINKIIEIGKQTIVEHIEKLLISGKPPIGLIFWLKNNDDWIDKTTTEHQERTDRKSVV